MTTLFLYVLASSHDPDNVECPVPYQVNDRVIFFGPCKKHLREWLRNNYLKELGTFTFANHEDIFAVGVNGSNPQHVRRIVWAGRITRLMTFETAYNERNLLGFQEMAEEFFSPLHVQPVYDDNRFLGYEHISHLHEDCWVSDVTKTCRATGQCPHEPPHGDKACWVLDIIESDAAPHTRWKKEQLTLAPGADRSRVFTRDCCFLCDNIFFAQGTGIPITEEMLAILRKAQPGKEKEIDAYAIFGHRSDGSADGLTGRYLTLCGKQAEDLMNLIKSSSPISPRTTKKPLKPCNCQ